MTVKDLSLRILRPQAEVALSKLVIAHHFCGPVPYAVEKMIDALDCHIAARVPLGQPAVQVLYEGERRQPLTFVEDHQYHIDDSHGPMTSERRALSTSNCINWLCYHNDLLDRSAWQARQCVGSQLYDQLRKH